MHQTSRLQFDKKRVKVLLQSGHRSSCAFFLTCCRGERKRKPFNLGSLFNDKLYMGHDVLLDAQQAQALQEYNIAVNVIPDYYYKELEG